MAIASHPNPCLPLFAACTPDVDSVSVFYTSGDSLCTLDSNNGICAPVAWTLTNELIGGQPGGGLRVHTLEVHPVETASPWHDVQHISAHDFSGKFDRVSVGSEQSVNRTLQLRSHVLRMLGESGASDLELNLTRCSVQCSDNFITVCPEGRPESEHFKLWAHEAHYVVEWFEHLQALCGQAPDRDDVRAIGEAPSLSEGLTSSGVSQLAFAAGSPLERFQQPEGATQSQWQHLLAIARPHEPERSIVVAAQGFELGVWELSTGLAVQLHCTAPPEHHGHITALGRAPAVQGGDTKPGDAQNTSIFLSGETHRVIARTHPTSAVCTMIPLVCTMIKSSHDRCSSVMHCTSMLHSATPY